ncbi:MAG: hypothetical protein Ct9H300mP20_11250 [Gammaproteobacteria bacterium]|nr:MAG: hypothetical protein Ct9H300mP20_11250 [Gammaproteobacteria bacterium]
MFKNFFSDYGAEVINLEPESGFKTPQNSSFYKGEKTIAPCMLISIQISSASLRISSKKIYWELVSNADLVLSNGENSELSAYSEGVLSEISWYGKGGDYENFVGTDAQCFALNGMLRGLGSIEDRPLSQPVIKLKY